MAKITSFVIILVVLMVTLAATPAAGQSRWRSKPRAVRTNRSAASRTVRPPSYSTRYRSAYPANYYYPKYTGGFHARYYDGIPSIYGTTRMRGTAW